MGEKIEGLKGARRDIRTILAACNAIQAYCKVQEPSAKKAAIAKYKDGTKTWVETDNIVVNDELIKFLEALA